MLTAVNHIRGTTKNLQTKQPLSQTQKEEHHIWIMIFLIKFVADTQKTELDQ